MEINGLYNEFALPGTSLQIKGKYFELYGFGKNSSSVIKFGDTELEIESVTDQVITAKLPGDIPDNIALINYLIGKRTILFGTWLILRIMVFGAVRIL